MTKMWQLYCYNDTFLGFQCHIILINVSVHLILYPSFILLTLVIILLMNWHAVSWLGDDHVTASLSASLHGQWIYWTMDMDYGYIGWMSWILQLFFIQLSLTVVTDWHSWHPIYIYIYIYILYEKKINKLLNNLNKISWLDSSHSHGTITISILSASFNVGYHY